MLRGEDDVAGGAGDGALARAFEVDVVFVREGEDVVALVAFDRFEQVSSGVLEVDFDPGCG